PLAMGSAASKVYSRLLLGRTVPWLQAGEGAQCSGEGKQPAEYVFGMSRVMELEAEWHKGLVAAKIDIRKAFDMLHRPALLSRLKQAIGDGPSFRSWQAMLADTTAVLQTSWGCSRLQLDRGIRQGSVESPILFGWLAALILRDVKCKHAWQDRHRVFDQLECQDLLFMDDGLLWAHTSKEVSRRLEEWAAELAVHGLKLNPAKCKAYFSPYCVSQSPVSVNGNLVPQVETLEVMGVPFRVGASASELLAPFLARGRDKFWSLKHLLRARTPLTGRILLLDKIIGGTSLWCLSALAPDASALALLNSMQLQCVVWAMREMVHSVVGKMVEFFWTQSQGLGQRVGAALFPHRRLQE
ncbi:pol, partial [Symbiodinium necroappetens]